MFILTPKEPCVEQSIICKNFLFFIEDIKVVIISHYFLTSSSQLDCSNSVGNNNYNFYTIQECFKCRDEAMKSQKME